MIPGMELVGSVVLLFDSILRKTKIAMARPVSPSQELWIVLGVCETQQYCLEYSSRAPHLAPLNIHSFLASIAP